MPTLVDGKAVVAILASLAWGSVGVVELIDIPNASLGVFVVPFVEAAIWAAALGFTIYIFSRVPRGGAALAVVVAVIGSSCFVYFTNWSVFEPRSYYTLHHWSFARVADLVDEGRLGAMDGPYYGEQLPRHLADLSTNGRAAAVALQDGKPVVFLPQFIGIPDDAVGYVYFAGEPDHDLIIDLFGYPATFADGEPLGDGWWYVR